jgi:hypothetical protein
MAKGTTTDADRLKRLDEQSKNIDKRKKVIAARAEYKKALADIAKK